MKKILFVLVIAYLISLAIFDFSDKRKSKSNSFLDTLRAVGGT